MTNFERFKQMNVAELADFIKMLDSCKACGFKDEDCEEKELSCAEGRKRWLLKESKGKNKLRY